MIALIGFERSGLCPFVVAGCRCGPLPVVLHPAGLGVRFRAASACGRSRARRCLVARARVLCWFISPAREYVGHTRDQSSVPAGPFWFNRRVLPSPRSETLVRPTRIKPLMRFPFVPFSVCQLRCAVRGSRPRTIPLRRLLPSAPFRRSRSAVGDCVLAVLSFVAPRVHRGRRPAPPHLPATIHADPFRAGVIRRGLSLARRSATRFLGRWIFTQPDRTCFARFTRAFRSGNAPGILMPFAVFPICGSRRL